MSNEIKDANKKALPKFIGTLVLCMIAGGLFGFVSSTVGLENLSGVFTDAGRTFSLSIAPVLCIAIAIALPIVCFVLYQGAKKIFDIWDGENEEQSIIIDTKLSIAMLLSSLSLIIDLFLMAAIYASGMELFESKRGVIGLAISVGAFFIIAFEAIYIQQKCVDMTKAMNPEKKGSVYDMKFHKTWMDSCDEAEKIMIGKCAMKSYTVTSYVCLTLSVVLAVAALIFDIGFLPALVVAVIWGVSQTTYCIEAMKYNKEGNSIM